MEYQIYAEGLGADENKQGAWCCIIKNEKGIQIYGSIVNATSVERATNNRMDLKAIIEGISHCEDYSNVEINTHSEVSCAVLADIRRNLHSGYKNADLIKKFDNLIIKKHLTYSLRKNNPGKFINKLMKNMKDIDNLVY